MTPRKPPVTVKCFCGKVLVNVRPNRKWCSVNCRVKGSTYHRWLKSIKGKRFDYWGDEVRDGHTQR